MFTVMLAWCVSSPRTTLCAPARDLKAHASLFSPFWPLTAAGWRCVPQVGHCCVCKGAVPCGRSSCYCQLLCDIWVGLSPILGPHTLHPLYTCACEWRLICHPSDGRSWEENGSSDWASGQELSSITVLAAFSTVVFCVGVDTFWSEWKIIPLISGTMESFSET